jgi:hypothetical protein
MQAEDEAAQQISMGPGDALNARTKDQEDRSVVWHTLQLENARHGIVTNVQTTDSITRTKAAIAQGGGLTAAHEGPCPGCKKLDRTEQAYRAKHAKAALTCELCCFRGHVVGECRNVGPQHKCKFCTGQHNRKVCPLMHENNVPIKGNSVLAPTPQTPSEITPTEPAATMVSD